MKQNLCLAGSILIFTAVCAVAQSNSAVILGTVTDSSGAAVVRATVTILNQGTNIATTATTKAEGQYVATNLEPGTYRVCFPPSPMEPR